MAPPGSYISTYRSYKTGTTRLTTWLIENARRCGADLSFLDSKKTSTSKFQVPIGQFTNLATSIASSTDPKIRIPQTISTLIRSVIDLRKQANTFFATLSRSKKDPANSAANAGHRHFISVLEDVLNILQPPDEISVEANLVNVFDALEVEEPTEPTSQGTAPPAKSKKVDSREYELETSAMDNIFAIFTFFKDINEIRSYLQGLWRDYRDGHVDLMAASVTTDVAFNFMKRSSHDIAESIPGKPNYTAMVAVLGAYVETFGGDTETFRKWVFADTAGLLMSYADVLAPDQVPAMKPGYFGVYNPSRDRSKLSPNEQQQEDLIVLMEWLPEVTKLSRTHVSVPAQDELTTALRVMMDNCSMDAMPTHGVFATQVFLDIHHILREHSTRPFDKLQATGKRVIDVLDDYFRFSRSRHIMNWPAQNDEVFKRLHTYAKDWTQTDVMAKLLKSTFRQLGVSSRPYYFLKNHPVMCGLVTFRLNMLLQDGGINLCTAWGSVIYPGHLYNASRQSAGLEAEWKDMDYVLSIHSPQRVFVGAPPTEPGDYLKRFLLALGGSASNFATNRRRGGQALIVESKKGPRGLKSTTPVKDIFRPRYVYDEPAAVMTTPNLVAMLSVASKAERTTAPSVDLQSFTREMLVQRNFTPIQLLQIVREGVAAEELHLLFDYFGLHQRGLKLLRTLQTHLHADLVKYFTDAYIEDESQLPYIIGYVFEVVAGSDRIAQLAGIQGQAGSRMLHNAADTLNSFLLNGENGRQSYMQAKALSDAVAHALLSGKGYLTAPSA